MPSDKFVASDTELAPLTVTVEQAEHLTGESRSQIYNRIGRGAGKRPAGRSKDGEQFT